MSAKMLLCVFQPSRRSLRQLAPYIRLFILSAASALATLNCEAGGGSPSKVDVTSLPEFADHQRCLGRQAFILSKAEGSPLELGIIAAAACGSTRHDLYIAITKIESRAFAQGYIRAAEREDPKLIARTIVQARLGQLPF